MTKKLDYKRMTMVVQDLYQVLIKIGDRPLIGFRNPVPNPL